MGVTYRDVALRAGVGTATVERVLNGRGGVRPETAARVLAAARALDHPRRLPEPHRGHLRIEVVLVRPDASFFRRLSGAFARIAATLDPAVSVHRTFLPEDDPEAIAARLDAPAAPRAGLIVALPDHPRVAAALARAQARGERVVQIVTGATGVAADLVGIDNAAAGRTAGLLLSRMQPRGGTVLALCHSGAYRVHRDRIRGFGDRLARHPRPDLHFDRVLFAHDEPRRVADLMAEALRAVPDLAGVYNAGGGNGALAEALRRHPRGRDLFVVGHELTDTSAAALREGLLDAVLDQAPEAQARRALDLVLHRLGLLEGPVENPAIRFVTVTAENL